MHVTQLSNVPLGLRANGKSVLLSELQFFLHNVCAEFYINTVVDEPGEEYKYFVWGFNKIFTTGGKLHEQ